MGAGILEFLIFNIEKIGDAAFGERCGDGFASSNVDALHKHVRDGTLASELQQGILDLGSAGDLVTKHKVRQ